MTSHDPIEVAVCVTRSATQAEECGVVLAASGMAHRLETSDDRATSATTPVGGCSRGETTLQLSI
jgi:hypothetical protein